MLKTRIERAYIEIVPDEEPDTSYLSQPEFADRREALNRGDFSFVGVRAVAELKFETEQGGWIHGPTVKSPGLWGIEDDSDESYLREIGDDESHELAQMLQALHVYISAKDVADMTRSQVRR